MANIYKRGRIWWGRCHKSGKHHRTSLRTETRSVAEKRFKKWIEGLEAIRWGEKPRRLFDDAAEKFAIEHFPTLTEHSASRYFYNLKNLGRTLAGLYLDQITTAKLMEFEQIRRSEGVTTTTIRRDLACLSSMFSHCIECEWVDANPVLPFMKRRRRRGLTEGAPRTRYLSHEEEAHLLESSPQYLAEAIAFAIDTGLRLGEHFSLEWSQINQVAGDLMLDGQITKNHRPRRVPLLPRAAQFLSQHPRHIRGPYVFCHKNGDRYQKLSRGLAGAAKRAGITDLKWHDLRRTCGCRLLQDQGLTINEVQVWLGHSSVVVTERSYAFLDMEKVRDRLKNEPAKIVPLHK